MKKILVFLLTVASLVTLATPVKSDNAAKGIAYIEDGSSAPTAADYVHDGLIAMWDGIENVGYGRHNDNSSVWVDLVGGRVANLTDNGSWTDDALVCNGQGYASNDGNRFKRDVVLHVELVFESEGDGIIAVLARAPNTTIGGIEFLQRGNRLFAMAVESVSSGLKNVIAVEPNQLVSVSLFYSPIDFIGGYVNGEWKSSFYIFSSIDFSTVCFGGRAQWTDSPWSGRIHSVRIYSRALTAEEVAYNYDLDRLRFNLP